MGIDIYMRWDRMSKGNREAQYTGGFSIVNGHTGYLREAYHGGIYATRYLVHEAFEDDAPPEGVPIPTDILRRRLLYSGKSRWSNRIEWQVLSGRR